MTRVRLTVGGIIRGIADVAMSEWPLRRPNRLSSKLADDKNKINQIVRMGGEANIPQSVIIG